MVMDRVGEPLEVREVPDPIPSAGGVVVRVHATGLCRSDWHAWAGHEDVVLPHVPGHELAGVVSAVGTGVARWSAGDRVTVPFTCGCGRCFWCVSGNAQVWHAAESVVTARRLAAMEPVSAAPVLSDPVAGRVAADIYAGLPESERAGVQSAMAQQLGPLWFGHPEEIDDHAATRPAHAAALHIVLAERGYLTRFLTQSPQIASPPLPQPLEVSLVRRCATRQATKAQNQGHSTNDRVHAQSHELRREAQRAVQRTPQPGPALAGRLP